MRFSVSVLTALLLLEGVAPAFAQSDTSGLVDRLDRLERDLNSLQSQVYRGGGRSSGAVASTDNAAAGNAYGMLDDRIDKIEEQLRDVTGQVERTQFNINELKAALDKLQADDKLHFQMIEDKLNGAAPPIADTGSKSDNAVPAQAAPVGSPPGFLVHPGDKPLATLPPNLSAAPVAPVPALPPNKSAADQYDYILGLLKNGDYDAAAAGFRAFLSAHAQDPLAGNADYWLGQIAFTQGHYEQAAVIFADVYKTYPKSSKAPESVLKIGLSLANLNRKKDACAALHHFLSEYPDALDSLKRQATAERQKQGC